MTEVLHHRPFRWRDRAALRLGCPRDIVETLAAEGLQHQPEPGSTSTSRFKAIGLHKVTLHLHGEVDVRSKSTSPVRAERSQRQAKGESLTSADAIYGVDEDALKPEDFFNPEAEIESEEE